MLVKLALFVIRACITNPQSDEYYGVRIEFSETQRRYAKCLHQLMEEHGAAFNNNECKAEDGEDNEDPGGDNSSDDTDTDVRDDVANMLYDLAQSFLFSNLAKDSQSWSSTFECFVMFNFIDRHTHHVIQLLAFGVVEQ